MIRDEGIAVSGGSAAMPVASDAILRLETVRALARRIRLPGASWLTEVRPTKQAMMGGRA